MRIEINGKRNNEEYLSLEIALSAAEKLAKIECNKEHELYYEIYEYSIDVYHIYSSKVITNYSITY